MSVFGKPKNSKQKVSYLSLEKARISFVPGQDKVQLTGILDGLSFKETIPAGSELEKSFRQSLLMKQDDYWHDATKGERSSDPAHDLPEISILNFGAKRNLSFEEAQDKSPEFRYTTPSKVSSVFNIEDFPQQKNDLRIPLGIVQNMFNLESPKTVSYQPFPVVENKPEQGYPARNIFLGGMPGRGKSIMLKTIIMSIKALDPEVEVVIYDPKRYNGGEYGVPAISDLLEFLVKMRSITRDSSKKYFVIIDELDSLIQFHDDQAWMEKRANKAIRAELLESMIFLSKHNANVSFAFSSQTPTDEHNGIIATCETIIDLGVDFPRRQLLGYVHHNGIYRSPSGRGYIKQAGFEDPKVFQPYISVDID